MDVSLYLKMGPLTLDRPTQFGDVNARDRVLTSTAGNIISVLKRSTWFAGLFVMMSCDMGPSASERYNVYYLDDLEGDNKVRYCEDFIALAGGSGQRPCSDGSVFIVQEVNECVDTPLPRCSIDDFETCVEAGLDDPCDLFVDPPFACLDFIECLMQLD